MHAPQTHHYGAHEAQFGELLRPDGPSAGVVVIIHGGFWRARYGLELGRPLAHDLARHGFTTWTIEYRRVGAGGGWRTTLDDVAAAFDALGELDVDTGRLVALGHSAGGQLATWAAWAAGAAWRLGDRVVRGVVAQAGVLDLATAARRRVGNTAIVDFLGGTPDQVPDRYAYADPMAHVPLSVPVLCLHARDDEDVPYSQSVTYVAAARAAGAAARLVEVGGGHFGLVDPDHESWRVTRDALPALLEGCLPG